MNLKSSKSETIFIVLITTGVILLIFFLIAEVGLIASFSSFNFEKTGQIGDTIGGIASPVINLFAALLVFYSFKTQIKANQIQSESLTEEVKSRKNDGLINQFVLLYHDIRADILNVTFNFQQEQHEGYSAIERLVERVNLSTAGLTTIEMIMEKRIWFEISYLLRQFKLAYETTKQMPPESKLMYQDLLRTLFVLTFKDFHKVNEEKHADVKVYKEFYTTTYQLLHT